MRYVLLGLLCFLLLLLGGLWLLFPASGHNMPAATTRGFTATALVIGALISLLGAWVYRSHQKERQQKKRFRGN